ncbi:MAG: cupin domain-containing protein [Cyclobacteriaceae bacterium]|nr:cupin domain-containing protein [Cyclobacteriaceae bacterium]
MPLVKKFTDTKIINLSSGIEFRELLSRNSLEDKRLQINYLKIDSHITHIIKNEVGEVSWIQIIEGNISVKDDKLDKSQIIFLSEGQEIEIHSNQNSVIIHTIIPNFCKFDPDLKNKNLPNMKIIDWGQEPVLKSEHDNRTRVYMISKALVNTNGVKGELIIYPKDTSCPEHYHVGAEHYQLIISGEVTAVLDGTECKLHALDVLYNFENENHWFYTTDNDCQFVEFFVPGEAKTIWTQTTNVCTWSPIGKNIKGGKPSRTIEKHVHGEGKGI